MTIVDTAIITAKVDQRIDGMARCPLLSLSWVMHNERSDARRVPNGKEVPKCSFRSHALPDHP